MIHLSTLTKRQRNLAILEAIYKAPSSAKHIQLKTAVPIQQSTLYITLKNFTQQGYLRPFQQEKSSQTLYGITPLGKTFLLQEKLAYALDIQAALTWCNQTLRYLQFLQKDN